MRTRLTFFLALAGLLGGCAHRHGVQLHPFNTAFERINAKAEDRSARVVLRDGRRWKGRELHVTYEQVSFTEQESGERRSVPTTEVERIVVYRYGKGALVGLGIGAGIAVPATVYGLQELCFDEGCDETQVAVGLGVGLSSLVLGPVLGGAIGNRDHFVFEGPLVEGAEAGVEPR